MVVKRGVLLLCTGCWLLFVIFAYNLFSDKRTRIIRKQHYLTHSRTQPRNNYTKEETAQWLQNLEQSLTIE